MHLQMSPIFGIGILASANYEGKAKFILWSLLLLMDYITLFNVTRLAAKLPSNPQLIVWNPYYGYELHYASYSINVIHNLSSCLYRPCVTKQSFFCDFFFILFEFGGFSRLGIERKLFSLPICVYDKCSVVSDTWIPLKECINLIMRKLTKDKK